MGFAGRIMMGSLLFVPSFARGASSAGVWFAEGPATTIHLLNLPQVTVGQTEALLTYLISKPDIEGVSSEEVSRLTRLAWYCNQGKAEQGFAPIVASFPSAGIDRRNPSAATTAQLAEAIRGGFDLLETQREAIAQAAQTAHSNEAQLTLLRQAMNEMADIAPVYFGPQVSSWDEDPLHRRVSRPLFHIVLDRLGDRLAGIRDELMALTRGSSVERFNVTAGESLVPIGPGILEVEGATIPIGDSESSLSQLDSILAGAHDRRADVELQILREVAGSINLRNDPERQFRKQVRMAQHVARKSPSAPVRTAAVKLALVQMELDDVYTGLFRGEPPLLPIDDASEGSGFITDVVRSSDDPDLRQYAANELRNLAARAHSLQHRQRLTRAVENASLAPR